ncbi:MAG: hypothetical protein V7L04_08505 [Nostoc sp.]|uniref:hypothetical protein n=1 Tax=Nostoc sp. TaxID=1180 RepID=UPI002FFA52AF
MREEKITMPNPQCPNCYEGKMSSPWSLAVNWIFAPGQTSLDVIRPFGKLPIARKRHQGINANNYFIASCVYSEYKIPEN